MTHYIAIQSTCKHGYFCACQLCGLLSGHRCSRHQGEGEGNRGQAGACRRSQRPLLVRFRHRLRCTAGLSAGSHPQSCHPLSWPSSSFYSSAKAIQSGTRISCLSASIYRKSRYFVNRPCHGLPMKTPKQDCVERPFLSAPIKPFEQPLQLKPADGS